MLLLTTKNFIIKRVKKNDQLPYIILRGTMRHIFCALMCVLSCGMLTGMDDKTKTSPVKIKILAKASFPLALYTEFFTVNISNKDTVAHIKAAFNASLNELAEKSGSVCTCSMCSAQKTNVKIARAVKDKACTLQYKRNQLSDDTTIAELLAKEFNPLQDCLNAIHT